MKIFGLLLGGHPVFHEAGKHLSLIGGVLSKTAVVISNPRTEKLMKA